MASAQGKCILKASLQGYESSVINLNDTNWYANRTLPLLVLERPSSNPSVTIFAETGVPDRASKPWSQAAKAAQTRNWAEAERFLRVTVQSAPGFAPGWNALGQMCHNQHKTAEAREAYRRAI